MAARPSPMFASEATAARLLDMAPGEFRALVKAGALPGPCDIGGHKRWEVEALRRIGSGDMVDGEAIQW